MSEGDCKQAGDGFAGWEVRKVIRMISQKTNAEEPKS
jgi:hypothetical protein